MTKTPRRPDIPLSIIGGYLGAGKTTLINHLLSGDHGLRLAVLVNDFGALNIDAGLIARHDGNTFSLTNGCVCCTIADDLGATLTQLITASEPPEQILIEASGVAEPAKMAIYGEGWPGLRLNAVLVMADAETIRARAKDKFVGGLVRRQLAAGDLLLLNKIDLLNAKQLADLRTWLGQQVGSTRIVETSFAVLPYDVLFAPHAPNKSMQGTDHEHRHDDAFYSLLVEDDRPWDRQAIEAVLADLPSHVMRAKGPVLLADDPWGDNFLQLVGKRWSIERRGERRGERQDGKSSGSAAATRLVLIGIKDGSDDDISQRLRACAKMATA